MGLGMGYAAALMVTGWYQYRRGSSLAPVFIACGAILIRGIVVETHARFKSLPLVPAYWTLMATGAGMAFVSRRFSVFLPVSVGTLGMCLAGAAIDLPASFLPLPLHDPADGQPPGVLRGDPEALRLASLDRASRNPGHVPSLGMRLAAVVAKKTTAAPTLASGWFLPVLAVLSVAFLAIALLGIVRSRDVKVSVFDFCLPTISAVGSYLAARIVVSEADGSALALNLVAILFALVHFGAAFGLALRKIDGVPGTNSFVVAGPPSWGWPFPPPSAACRRHPFLGAAALGVAVLSDRWGSGAVRVTPTSSRFTPVVSLAYYFLAHGFPASALVGTVPAPRWPRPPWAITDGADATLRPPALLLRDL